MAPLILSGKDRSAADTTNGCRDEMISEPHAVGGETIDVRRLNDSIARTTQRVEPLIVGEDENTIALTRQFCGMVRRRPGCVTADKTKKCEAKDLDAKSSGVDNGRHAMSIPGDGRAGLRSGTGLESHSHFAKAPACTSSASGVLPSSAAATFRLQTHRDSAKSRPRPTRLRPRTRPDRQFREWSDTRDGSSRRFPSP